MTTSQQPDTQNGSPNFDGLSSGDVSSARDGLSSGDVSSTGDVSSARDVSSTFDVPSSRDGLSAFDVSDTFDLLEARFPDDLPPTGAWQAGDPLGDRILVNVVEPTRPFALEAGGHLSEVRVAYETWGNLNEDASNAVLVCHALTGDSHAAGDSSSSHPTAGWWNTMIGPGRAIDTDRYFVVCSNVLGGCQGTTGPADYPPSSELSETSTNKSDDLVEGRDAAQFPTARRDGAQFPTARQRYGARFPTEEPEGAQFPTARRDGAQFATARQRYGARFPTEEPEGAQFATVGRDGAQFATARQRYGARFPTEEPEGARFPTVGRDGAQFPMARRRYGARFPTVTVRDMVRVQSLLADHLGVRRWLAVVGGSMGGMQVLEWATIYPHRVRSILPLATCAAASPLQIAWSAIGRLAIAGDPHWNGGDYYESSQGPWRGLAIARELAQVTYRSGDLFDKRFGRHLRDRRNLYELWGRFQIESYLDHHGQKLARRFDANSYLILNKSMDLHDIGRGRPGGVSGVLRRINVPVLTASITTDILYPKYQQDEIRDGIISGGGDCRHLIIETDEGHDGFLLRDDKMHEPMSAFLDEVASSS